MLSPIWSNQLTHSWFDVITSYFFRMSTPSVFWSLTEVWFMISDGENDLLMIYKSFTLWHRISITWWHIMICRAVVPKVHVQVKCNRIRWIYCLNIKLSIQCMKELNSKHCFTDSTPNARFKGRPFTSTSCFRNRSSKLLLGASSPWRRRSCESCLLPTQLSPFCMGEALEREKELRCSQCEWTAFVFIPYLSIQM